MGWESVMLAAARAAAVRCDVRVVERSGWKTRGHGNVGSLQGTLWHDTVTPYSWSDDKLGGLLANGYSGLPGPIANVGIGSGGNIILIAGRKAHHAGTGSWSGISSGNSNTLGIEVQNPGRPTPWRDIQLTVVRAFVEEVHRRAGLPGSKAIGHKDWASGRKVDPWSVDMAAERRRLTERLSGEDDELNSTQDQRLRNIEQMLEQHLDRDRKPSLWRDVDVTKQAVGRTETALGGLANRVADAVVKKLSQ